MGTEGAASDKESAYFSRAMATVEAKIEKHRAADN